MKLFELKNYILTISPEAYALKVFRVLWNRDKTKTKDRAFAEMSFVFYMEDFRSDYSGILDEVDRRTEVMKQMVLPKGWKEDKLVKDARLFYQQQNDKIYAIRFVQDAQLAMDKIRQFFRDVDLDKVDRNGKLIYDVSKLDRVLGNSASLLKNLTELEEQAKQALQENQSNVRGGKQKAVFEDGI